MGNTSTIGTICTRLLILVCLGFMIAITIPQTAEATHFRSGTISWVPTGNPGQVEIRMKTVWRAGFFSNPGIGQNVNIGGLIFGDGSSIGLGAYSVVVNRNISEDWIEVETTLTKQYSSFGPFTVRFRSSARLSNLTNAANAIYSLETIISPYSGNNSPVSNQFPLINVSQAAPATFFVSAADPDGDQLRYRLATPQESGINNIPGGLSINPSTGQVTWNTSSITPNLNFAIQVIVQDLDSNGNIKSKIPVDFMMRIIEAQQNLPDPPVCEIAQSGPFNITIGNPISLDIAASSPDASVNVTLAGIGLPSGSSMNPELPASALETVSSQFNWTPTASQTGSFVITFSATDQFSQQTQCGATINVTTNQPPIADAGSDQTVQCTSCDVTLDGSNSSDPDGDPLTYTWTGSFGTVSGVNPTVPLTLGDNVITLTVDDGRGGSDSTTITVTLVNSDPIADAGPDQNVDCTNCEVTLDGSNSTDPDGDDITHTWSGDFGTSDEISPTIKFEIGEHEVVLLVEDDFGGSDTDTVIITVTNTPPIANAGPDQTIECPGCEIVLDGSDSSDPDGHELTYTWTWEGGNASGVNPVIDLPLGEHPITLTVEDECAGVHTDEVVITVVDTTPPVLLTTAEPIILWSPNHKYHTFDIADYITEVGDTCDENVALEHVVITRVTSDEPEEQSGSNNGKGRNGGGGDGNTTNDIIIADDGLSVELRAERLGGGNGRVYTVYVGVSDSSGNITESSFQVHVPKSKKSGTIDDGLINGYEVSGNTPEPPEAEVIATAMTTSETTSESAPSAQIAVEETSTMNETSEFEGANIPDAYGLNQNYPNPFNPSTVIRYQVPVSAHVKLQVFDITGRLVSTLVNESRSPGEHEVNFNASNLNSGIYLYRISAGNYVEIQRMTLIK